MPISSSNFNPISANQSVSNFTSFLDASEQTSQPFTPQPFPNLYEQITQPFTPQQFQKWSKQNPDWMNTLEDIPGESTYKRFNFTVFQNEVNSPVMMFSINTTNGDIYLDNCFATSTSTDGRSTLMVKHLCYIFLRPIQIIIKMLQHATSIPTEAYKYDEGQSLEETKMNIRNSCEDLIRTPLHGIAMTVAHIAAVIIGTVYPSSVYHFREWIGNQDLELHRLERYENYRKKEAIMGSACFTPIGNISTLHNPQAVLDPETNEYEMTKIACNQFTIKEGFFHLAEGSNFVKILRKHRA